MVTVALQWMFNEHDNHICFTALSLGDLKKRDYSLIRETEIVRIENKKDGFLLHAGYSVYFCAWNQIGIPSPSMIVGDCRGSKYKMISEIAAFTNKFIVDRSVYDDIVNSSDVEPFMEMCSSDLERNLLQGLFNRVNLHDSSLADGEAVMLLDYQGVCYTFAAKCNGEYVFYDAPVMMEVDAQQVFCYGIQGKDIRYILNQGILEFTYIDEAFSSIDICTCAASAGVCCKIGYEMYPIGYAVTSYSRNKLLNIE